MSENKEGDITSEEISSGRYRRVSHLENLMVVVFEFTDGPMDTAEPQHTHPHEQITYVAEGELLFFKGTSEYHLSKGDIMTIPSGIAHSIKTLTSHVTLIDSFCPLRKDFLKPKE
jgi:quercetin dioxygenase-like cupin family protein